MVGLLHGSEAKNPEMGPKDVDGVLAGEDNGESSRCVLQDLQAAESGCFGRTSGGMGTLVDCMPDSSFRPRRSDRAGEAFGSIGLEDVGRGVLAKRRALESPVLL